jgi:hypothetical protein
MTPRRLIPVFLPALLAAGCSDEPAPPVSGPPAGIAVIGSDYKSVSVPLADATTGAIVREGCITSGSKPPGLTTALSGDVVLPSQPQPSHELLLIDRANATLTWVNPRTCEVLRQLNVGEGMSANPHDVITVSAHKAYVTRYAPAASDLLVIDPAAATILGHIALGDQSTRPDGDRPVRPMPDRGIFTGGRVYLTLNELSDDFKSAGPARLVVIDPATDAVSTIDLPTLQNCGTLTALESVHRLAVGCSGVFDDPGQLAASGVGWIDLGVTPPAIQVVFAAEFAAPVSSADLAVLTPDLAFTVVPGDFTSMRADALWAFDFAGGAPRKILDGSGPFALGGLVADAANKKLFIGDAADQDPRILVIDATMSTVEKTISVSGLPPRSLGFY